MNVEESTVLIVDDSMMTRKMMKQIIKDLGFRNIVECSDGHEAITEIDKKRFHVVISDWYMPKVSGLELLKHVRDELNKSKEDLPFLMVTSAGEKEEVMEAIQLGVSNYIVKPFNHDTVREKLLPHFPELGKN